jgi:serine/threonine-protein kinase
MSARVRLTVIQGSLTGASYEFTGRDTCIIGRGLDCNPRLPDDEAHRTISRNHCLVDINAPDIRIRDFGSLNGTFVNDEKIGQRAAHVGAHEVALSEFPEYDLKEGDRIRLGGTVFVVSVESPAYCVECGAEVAPEKKERLKGSDGYLCDRHFGDRTTRKKSDPDRTTEQVYAPRCSRCGKDVTDEIGQARRGDYLCRDCKADPLMIVNALMEQADARERESFSITGYSLVRELGRGGMGAVYLARKEETGQLVALKVMLPEVATDAGSRAMFIREAENTRALTHPNIVRLLDSGYADGAFFFTLEYCDGGSVDRLMEKRGGKLPPKEALDIILPVLDGLAYAHTAAIETADADGTVRTVRGVIHRDIKPANIFLSGDGAGRTPKLADMGLGKAFDMAGLSGQTRTGSVIGTPFFMPRQQVINFKYAKPDVDVWSAAAALYNMLTGKLPRKFLKGRDPWQVVLQSPAVPILERDPSIPAKLAKVIDAALVDNPEIPYKRADELAALLKDADDGR